jgi:hypothetical protein
MDQPGFFDFADDVKRLRQGYLLEQTARLVEIVFSSRPVKTRETRHHWMIATTPGYAAPTRRDDPSFGVFDPQPPVLFGHDIVRADVWAPFQSADRGPDRQTPSSGLLRLNRLVQKFVAPFISEEVVP